MKNNILSITVVLIALASISILSTGCGLIGGLVGGAVVEKDTIKVAEGFEDYRDSKTYNSLLTQTVAYNKIYAEKGNEGKFASYNDIFKQSAVLQANARQMKFGLNKIKSGEVKMSVKIDPSMISGGPRGIAANASKIATTDEQTKFGFKVLESVLKAKDEMKGKVEALTSKISGLKPQEEFKGKEAASVGTVLESIKQAQASLNSATSDLEESVKILGELAK